MNPFFAEFLGTALLILMGTGVVANVVLPKTYGHNSGLIVIVFGWSIAVFTGVFIAAPYSGAHLNPAVTLALACCGKFNWAQVPYYIIAQIAGAMTGAFLTWMSYKTHFDEPGDAQAKLNVFCTAPAIKNNFYNFITEMIGTFVLVIGVLFMVPSESSLGTLNALPVALLVLGIGLSLGGPTGYAINPARDLGTRMIHAVLPIPGKRDSNWTYAWIPVVAPITGALWAALVFNLLAK